MHSLAVRDVPKLVVSTKPIRKPKHHSPSVESEFRYRSKNHKSLPHVVKFSGGRSSGMLLFLLLENGLLDAERGDVIVFNNTSAEHPNTYRFVHDCMRASRKYGIPFFQIEFQTYEDSRKGEWTRIASYRLVNDRPKSEDNPDGYHWRGEAFEELLSWTGYVPNQFNRICTRHLKLDATRNFLKDWLACKPTIPRLGHYGSSSRIDPDALYRRHLANQGSVPKGIFLKKRQYVWQCPHYRPEQHYADFCPNWKLFNNESLKEQTFGDKAWIGKGGAKYVAVIGLRGDEPHRVQRVSTRDGSSAGYEGENVYMPLDDMSITKEDVDAFWERQSWDLKPIKNERVSNCVFCFLKGSANLDLVLANLEGADSTDEEGFGPLKNTPSDLEWWTKMESDYGRDLDAEGRLHRGDVKRIGFFGTNSFGYESIKERKHENSPFVSMLPCDCTE